MPREKDNGYDWINEPIYDEENMIRVNAVCDKGHTHLNLPIAIGLDSVGVKLPDFPCNVLVFDAHSVQKIVCGAPVRVLA